LRRGGGARTPRLVLAVSGGRDSMVLLDVMARSFGERVACVATFDHGTGRAASDAAELVVATASELGFPVRPGRLGESTVLRREAAWREARWRFLREVALEADAAVSTAHTRDDQVETVFMRALRGSWARGLAGLYARSAVVRPLLELSREDVADYAAERGVSWVEDPSNQSRSYLRNRARLELLPVLERAHPGLSAELLELARRAAKLRAEVDEYLERSVPARIIDGALEVARADLQGYDGAGLGLLWPALAARVGAVLDRRGTERITQFTIKGRAGARIQLSGGWEAVLHRDLVVLRRTRPEYEVSDALSLDGALAIGGWRFRPLHGLEGKPSAGMGKWRAALPADSELSVRPWRPGDRITPSGATVPRRVKGLFRDAGVDAGRRIGWPVVLAGDEIVWVPGVRHSAASTVLSDRPVVVYECERNDD
jgi:tRNA(Ile)-lysidine synthase